MKPIKMQISPTHPLLILMAESEPTYEETGEGMVRLWNELDDDIRPCVTVQIEGTRSNDFQRNEALLGYAEDAGLPITLQVQGDNGDRHDTVPFDRVQDFVERYSCIVGLQIVEASQRTFADHPGGPEYTMGRNARYARDIIRLAGEYGLFMSWQLMRENYAAIGCSGDNEALYDTICEYSDYVIPMHEMNCEFAKHVDHMGAMGLWLAGATKQWGVEAQSWYWSDCGYNTPGCSIPGTLDMPGGLYAIMFLLGAGAGACAYSIEPPKDVWKGPDAWRFTEYLGPVFRRFVTERLIPDREEMLDALPLAYHLPRCRRPADFRAALEDLDFDHNEGRLTRATFGVYDRARDAELIPNDPRCSWIPILPTKTPEAVLERFGRVLCPGDITSVEQAREIADRYFPPVDRGDAWSVVAGPVAIATNTHENWYVPETVKLDVPRRPDDVEIVQKDGKNILTWSAHAGDTGYRVWRLKGDVETCLTPEPVAETEYELPDINTGVRYAVSAITTAREELKGTLHLHQFLCCSMVESRRSRWVDTTGTSIEQYRIGETFPGADKQIHEREARCAECSPVEDLASPVIAEDDPHRAEKTAVMEAITGWKTAVEAEDLDGILSFYADDYREPDGRTIESVEVVFRSILWRYLKDDYGKYAEEWGCVPAWQYPVLKLLVRNWNVVSDDEVHVDVVFEMWAGTGPEMEPSDMFKHPCGRGNEMTMVWKFDGVLWQIFSTTPAFLRMEDTFPYRFCYQGW